MPGLIIPSTSARALKSIDALVLAGGLGTRTAEFLVQTPKLLAPLAGRPYLDYLVHWLGLYGVRRVVLSLGHLAEEVLRYLDSHTYANMEVVPIVEPAPLGTLGGIAHCRGQVHSDPILVVNGDTYIDADLGAFLEFHRSQNFAASLVCTMVDDASRYGGVEFDEQGAITAFREKQPDGGGAGYISGGMYLLGAEALDHIGSIGTGSVERDFFADQSALKLGAFAGRYQFIDFGTPESIQEAQEFFAALGFFRDQ